VNLRIAHGILVGVMASTAAVALAQTPEPAKPTPSNVRAVITSPQAGDYLSGSTRLVADISPSTEVASASFFMDGTEVCVFKSAPYACNWDAGRGIRDHQVRLMVTLKDGRRLPAVIIRTPGLPFADTSEVDGVQVTVTVTSDGKFVPGLSRSAFRIWEDGRPQTISSFVSEDVPLELIVAVDVSGSMADAMPKVKSAVKEFLVAVPLENQATVMSFSDYVITVARKTTTLDERLRAVDRLSALGATSLYDAIAKGIETLGQQAGRKALVVFSDGEDQGSQLTIEEVEQRLQASDVTLYMIGQGRGLSAEPLKRVMQRLADPTGGRALFTDSIDKLQEAFAELLVELSHQYLLGYQSTNTARDGTYRELRVEVEGSGRVRARKGYVAAREKN
jgi:Ca-activated chloride channel family protein